MGSDLVMGKRPSACYTQGGGCCSLITMDVTIHASFRPHDDPDASLASYGDTLGFKVRSDSRRPQPPASPTASAAPSSR